MKDALKIYIDNTGPEDSNRFGEIYQIKNGWRSSPAVLAYQIQNRVVQ